MIDRSLPRVLFVSHTSVMAGAERALINLLEHLPKGVLQPLVAFPMADGAGKTYVRKTLGLPVLDLTFGISLPMTNVEPKAMRAETELFRQVITELEIDVVVVNTTTLYPATFAAASCGVPVLLHSHGILDQRMLPDLDAAAWHRYQALQLQLADRVLVPSAWVNRYYQQAYHRAERDATLLPNGTPLPAPTEPAAGKTPRFAMLCTLEPNKGVLVFLEAAARVLAGRPGAAAFDIYGDGPATYRIEAEDFIRKHNLAGNCALHAKVADVAAVYRNCTAAVVASRIESFSFVAIEAMSAGRAVIATRCGGPDDIVVDGVTGRLVPVDDAEALATAMIELIDAPATAVAMGRAGRRRAEAEYDIDVVARKYTDVILSVAAMTESAEWRRGKRAAWACANPLDCVPAAPSARSVAGVVQHRDGADLRHVREMLESLRHEPAAREQSLLRSMEEIYANLRETNRKTRSQLN